MYDFKHLTLHDMLGSQGKTIIFDSAKYRQTVKNTLESTYFGITFVDIYNMALEFKDANLAIAAQEVPLMGMSPSVLVTCMFMLISAFQCLT